jgi:hypothetical protein
LSAATIAPERRYGGQDTELEFEAASTAGRPRLVFYYQHTAAIAEGRLARQARTTPAPAVLASPPTAIPDLPDSMQALAWARAERANLIACLDHATRTGQGPGSSRSARALPPCCG